MLPPFPRSKKVNLGALSRIVSSEPSISSTFAAPKLEKVITLFYYIRKLHSNLFTSQHCIYGVQFGHYSR